MDPYEVKIDDMLICEVMCCGNKLVVTLDETTRDNQYPLKKVKCEICKSCKVIKTFIKCQAITERETEKFKFQTVFHKYYADEGKCGRSRMQCVNCKQMLFAQMVKQSDFVTIEYVKCTNKLCDTENRIAELNGPTEQTPLTTAGQWRNAQRNKRAEQANKDRQEFLAIREEFKREHQLVLKNKFAVLSDSDGGDKETTSSLSDFPSTPSSRRADKRKNSTSPGETGHEHKRITQKLPENPQTEALKSDSHAAAAWQRKTATLRSQQNRTSTLVSPQPPIKNKEKTGDQPSISRRPDRKFPAVVVYSGESVDSDRAAALLARQTDCTFSVDEAGKRYFFRPRSLESRTKLLELLATKPDIEYFTHGTKQERRPSRKFVAKGLRAAGYTEEELAQSITEDYAITPTRVIPLQKEVMLLIFPGDVDPRDVREINRIANQCVKIEKYKVKRTAVTQCKNCLAFGHVQAHCRMKKIEATVTMTDHNGTHKIICSVCGGEDHTAKQAKCPAFKNEIEMNKKRRELFNKKNIKKVPIRPANIKEGVSFAQAAAQSGCQSSEPPQHHEQPPSILPESLELLGKLLTPDIVMKLIKFLTAFAG